jgi:hypothetical protein
MDPRAMASTNLGFSSSPAMVSITSQPDEPLRIEYPDAVLLTNNTAGRLSYLTYRPQISADTGHKALTATNRGLSKYLGVTNPGSNQPTADGGTGEGTTATSAISGYVVMAPNPGSGGHGGKLTLYIGGKLYNGGSGAAGVSETSALNITDVIPNTKQVGFYDGEITLNVLYLN